MASLGLTFYDGDKFPAEYHHDGFASEHGSWNRARRVGYKVIRIPLNDGKATGEFEDFLTRIMNEDCLNKMGIDSAEGILGEAVMNFTRMVLAYMEQTYDFVDDHVAEDFRSSLHKAFAYQCGAQFAGCFLKHRGSGKSQLEQIHLELSKGVLG